MFLFIICYSTNEHMEEHGEKSKSRLSCQHFIRLCLFHDL